MDTMVQGAGTTDTDTDTQCATGSTCTPKAGYEGKPDGTRAVHRRQLERGQRRQRLYWPGRRHPYRAAD